jgi:NAD(P)-dependent dehydrogenase (short-subunit alcohol dehydrogenase family)
MSLFTGKTAIITGGASGIGLAVSKELARHGAHVVIADINGPAVEKAAESISKEGSKARAVRLDVTDVNAVKKLVDDVVSRNGRLDYLFNNAGIGVGGEARDFEYEDWKNVIDVNLYGVVNGVVAAYSLMVRQGFGHIINTSSLAGIVPFPFELSYTTSKFGVVGLSNALRVEGRELGVKVSVVCPGFIDTPIYYTSKAANIDREKSFAHFPKFLSADECARIILKGVERNKAIIVVTLLAKVLWILHRISPEFTFRIIMSRFARQMRELRIKK